jgi:hypothetical protein
MNTDSKTTFQFTESFHARHCDGSDSGNGNGITAR